MSLLKNTGKTLLKAPLKVATIPLSLVAPKGVRKNQRYFVDMVRAQHAVACPFCGHGRLLAVSELRDYENGEVVTEEPMEADSEEKVKPDGQLWQCNLCYQHIKTKKRKTSEVVSYIKNNGRNIYEGGSAYQERQDKLESGELRKLVSKRIKYSRLFFILAGLTIIPFLYGAAKGVLLYSITTLLFGVMLGFIGISNSYRAWQLYTDNVYTEDAKAQFHWWLRNRNWFISPENPDYDIGLTSDEVLYEEAGIYDEYYEQDDSYENAYVDGELYPQYEVADFSLLDFYYVPAVYIEPQAQQAAQDEPPRYNMYQYQAQEPVNRSN